MHFAGPDNDDADAGFSDAENHVLAIANLLSIYEFLYPWTIFKLLLKKPEFNLQSITIITLNVLKQEKRRIKLFRTGHRTLQNNL